MDSINGKFDLPQLTHSVSCSNPDTDLTLFGYDPITFTTMDLINEKYEQSLQAHSACSSNPEFDFIASEMDLNMPMEQNASYPEEGYQAQITALQNFFDSTMDTIIEENRLTSGAYSTPVVMEQTQTGNGQMNKDTTSRERRRMKRVGLQRRLIQNAPTEETCVVTVRKQVQANPQPKPTKQHKPKSQKSSKQLRNYKVKDVTLESENRKNWNYYKDTDALKKIQPTDEWKKYLKNPPKEEESEFSDVELESEEEEIVLGELTPIVQPASVEPQNAEEEDVPEGPTEVVNLPAPEIVVTPEIEEKSTIIESPVYVGTPSSRRMQEKVLAGVEEEMHEIYSQVVHDLTLYLDEIWSDSGYEYMEDVSESIAKQCEYLTNDSIEVLSMSLIHKFSRFIKDEAPQYKELIIKKLINDVSFCSTIPRMKVKRFVFPGDEVLREEEIQGSDYKLQMDSEWKTVGKKVPGDSSSAPTEKTVMADLSANPQAVQFQQTVYDDQQEMSASQAVMSEIVPSSQELSHVNGPEDISIEQVPANPFQIASVPWNASHGESHFLISYSDIFEIIKQMTGSAQITPFTFFEFVHFNKMVVTVQPNGPAGCAGQCLVVWSPKGFNTNSTGDEFFGYPNESILAGHNQPVKFEIPYVNFINALSMSSSSGAMGSLGIVVVNPTQSSQEINLAVWVHFEGFDTRVPRFYNTTLPTSGISPYKLQSRFTTTTNPIPSNTGEHQGRAKLSVVQASQKSEMTWERICAMKYRMARVSWNPTSKYATKLFSQPLSMSLHKLGTIEGTNVSAVTSRQPAFSHVAQMHQLSRGDIVATIQVVCAPLNRGRIAVFFAPGDSSGTLTYNQLQSYQKKIIDIQSANTAEFKMAFTANRDMPTSNFVFGTFYAFVVNPFISTEDSPSGEVNFIFHAENVAFSIPIQSETTFFNDTAIPATTNAYKLQSGWKWENLVVSSIGHIQKCINLLQNFSDVKDVSKKLEDLSSLKVKLQSIKDRRASAELISLQPRIQSVMDSTNAILSNNVFTIAGLVRNELTSVKALSELLQETKSTMKLQAAFGSTPDRTTENTEVEAIQTPYRISANDAANLLSTPKGLLSRFFFYDRRDGLTANTMHNSIVMLGANFRLDKDRFVSPQQALAHFYGFYRGDMEVKLVIDSNVNLTGFMFLCYSDYAYNPPETLEDILCRPHHVLNLATGKEVIIDAPMNAKYPIRQIMQTDQSLVSEYAQNCNIYFMHTSTTEFNVVVFTRMKEGFQATYELPPAVTFSSFENITTNDYKLQMGTDFSFDAHGEDQDDSSDDEDILVNTQHINALLAHPTEYNRRRLLRILLTRDITGKISYTHNGQTVVTDFTVLENAAIHHDDDFTHVYNWLVERHAVCTEVEVTEFDDKEYVLQMFSNLRSMPRNVNRAIDTAEDTLRSVQETAEVTTGFMQLLTEQIQSIYDKAVKMIDSTAKIFPNVDMFLRFMLDIYRTVKSESSFDFILNVTSILLGLGFATTIIKNCVNIITDLFSREHHTEKGTGYKLQFDALSYVSIFGTVIGTVVNGVPVTLSRVEKFAKWVGDISYTAFKIDRGIESIKKCYNWIKENLIYCFAWWMDDDSMISLNLSEKILEWLQSCQEILEGDPEKRIICDPDYANRLIALRDQGLDLEMEIAEDGRMSKTVQIFLTHLTNIKTIAKNHEKNPERGKRRREPFWFFLWGTPGGGKTKLTEALKLWFAKKRGWTVSPGLCYNRNPKTKFFDGYMNNPLMKYDEFGQSVDGVDIDEMICIKSESPMPVYMADLADKKMYFCSEVILSCSNMAFPVANKNIYCAEALYRRRDYMVELVVKPEYIDGCRLKFDKIKEPWEHCYFKRTMKPDELNSPVKIFQTVDEMLDDLESVYDDFLYRTTTEPTTSKLPDPKNVGTIKNTSGLGNFSHSEPPKPEPLIPSLWNDFPSTLNPSVPTQDLIDAPVFNPGPTTSSTLLLPNTSVPPPQMLRPEPYRIQMDRDDEDTVSSTSYGSVQSIPIPAPRIHKRETIEQFTVSPFPVAGEYEPNDDDWTQMMLRFERGAHLNSAGLSIQDAREIDIDPDILEDTDFIDTIRYDSSTGKFYLKYIKNTWIPLVRIFEMLSPAVQKHYYYKHHGKGVFSRIKLSIKDIKQEIAQKWNFMYNRVLKHVEWGKICMFVGILGLYIAFVVGVGKLAGLKPSQSMLGAAGVPVVFQHQAYSQYNTRPQQQYVVQSYNTPGTRPSPQYVVQMAEDKSCEALRTEVIGPRVVRISCRATSMLGMPITGRHILMPKHFFDVLKPTEGEAIMIRYKNVNCLSTFSSKRLTVIGNDAVVFEASKTLTEFKNIVHHFVTKSDLAYCRKFSGTLAMREEDTCFPVHMSEIKMVYQTKIVDQNVNYIHPMAFSYSYSKNGACGAPLLLQNSRIARKIVGFHIAGCDGQGGLAIPVTQEDLKAFAKIQGDPAIVPSYVNYDLQHATIHPEGSYIVHGTVPKGKEVYSPPNTNIQPSLIFEKAFKRAEEPSVLRNNDPRNKSGITSSQRMVQKYGREILGFRDDDIEAAVQGLKDFIEPLDFDLCRELTEDEVINGIPEVQYIDGLKMNSSPGRPYKSLPEAKGGKAFLFSGEPGQRKISHPLLRQNCDEREKLAAENRRFLTECEMIKKDELRPLEKIEQGKTRAINSFPLDFTICFNKQVGCFSAFWHKNYLKLPSGVGMNTKGPDFTRLAHSLLTHSPNIIAGDFGCYDGSLPPDLIIAAGEIIIWWYWKHDPTMTKERENKIRTYFRELAHRVEIGENVCWETIQGNGSGNPITSILNTIVLILMFMCVWRELSRKFALYCIAVYHFFRCVKLFGYGDDNIMSVTEEVLPWFNQVTISECFKSHNIEYTMEDKHSDVVAFRDLQQCTFLKNGFRFDDAYPELVHPLMDMKTIKHLTNWTRKGLDQKEALYDNIENALEFVHHYGEEEFNDFLSKVNSALSSKGLRAMSFTYNDYREAWLSQFFN